LENQMIWCPYTNKEWKENDTNLEHIIPLSLGGCDDFSIPVNRDFNSRVGSDIDGKLANEFPIAIRRVSFGATGHSKKEPTVALKKSIIKESGDPVQLVFQSSSSPRLWDPKQRRFLDDHEYAGKSIQSSFQISKLSRMRFMCKAALSAGYFIYGNEFKTSFAHDELRLAMNIDKTPVRSQLNGLRLRLYDEFSPIAEQDKQQVMLDSKFCSDIQGSCVIAIPGEVSIGFVFGILGKWIGTLNVPADTSRLPCQGDFDLGHIVKIESGAMIRMSYRELARHALAKALLTRKQSPEATSN
jgi:hypothetical protein